MPGAAAKASTTPGTRWPAADALAGYRYAPHLDVRLSGHPDFSCRVRTNGRGLRTPFERGPVDVIALGDSFTFGYGVDEAETWPARLAELTGWSVANLGVSGYGPQSELALLRSEGPALPPRLLLWQFFANDLEDASLFALAAVRRPRSVRLAAPGAGRSPSSAGSPFAAQPAAPARAQL